MRKKEIPQKIRKRISSQTEELVTLQNQMLRPREMLAASLIKRYLGTSTHKRKSEAFYLSRAKKGKTYLQHISKSQLGRVRMRVESWKAYKEYLRRWQQLTKSIEQDFKKLAGMQSKRKLPKNEKKS